MYSLNDTIVAISSPSGGIRSIVRITGPQAIAVCKQVFRPDPDGETRKPRSAIRDPILLSGSVRITDALTVDARLYLFFAPRSYTGDPLAEIHIDAGGAIVEALVQRLLSAGLRPAGPGEFTARAYLNGKLDLAQAEAVNEIVSSSNRLQLDAARRLLSGRLTTAADEIRSALLDVLSLIEAGLDFSDEDIKFIGAAQAAERLADIETRLDQLLAGSIRCEALMDLPAIGIAGAPNAGKSSLLNTLLGWQRSIVSPQPGTTRDVLSGVLTIAPAAFNQASNGSARRPTQSSESDRGGSVKAEGLGDGPAHGEPPIAKLRLTLPPGGRQGFASAPPSAQAQNPPASHFAPHTSDSLQCVLFDCAGLLLSPDNLLEELAQRGAIEALQSCHAVVFCVDSAKPDWSEDLAVRAMIEPKHVICVATKSDLLPGEQLPRRVRALAEVFGTDFLPNSAMTGQGRQELLDAIAQSAIRNPQSEIPSLLLTVRHRQAIVEAQDSVRQAVEQVRRGHDEIAATMIRDACEAISRIERQHIDEQVLDRIFSRFCIGK